MVSGVRLQRPLVFLQHQTWLRWYMSVHHSTFPESRLWSTHQRSVCPGWLRLVLRAGRAVVLLRRECRQQPYSSSPKDGCSSHDQRFCNVTEHHQRPPPGLCVQYTPGATRRLLPGARVLGGRLPGPRMLLVRGCDSWSALVQLSDSQPARSRRWRLSL